MKFKIVFLAMLFTCGTGVAAEDFNELLLKGRAFLSQHRFAEALETGQRLTKMRPQDPMSHALAGDAAVELGLYEVAASEFQTMINLKPNLASYSRAAYIRELHGDAEGALALMKMALDASGGGHSETVAWCLFQIGLLHFKQGSFLEAEKYYRYSLEILPKYHLAYEHLAELRFLQGKQDEAISMYKEVIAQNPQPEYYQTLSSIYAKKGNLRESRKAADICEKLYLRGIREGNVEFYRGLAQFYLSTDRKLKRALDFAKKDVANTPSVYAYDTLAWAYYKNKQYDKASDTIKKALSLGTRDASFYYHAGMISLARGEKEKAEQWLSQAREINPHFSE